MSTYHNNDVVAVRNNRVDVNIELGQIRATGRSTFVQSTYAARYNFAVRNYNYLDDGDGEKKRNMRGGRFFLYNIIAITFFIGSSVCISNSRENKPLITVPIIISIIYLFLTCYNWHIRRTNGSLVHECMIRVPDHYLPDTVNKHLTIPLHANVQNREFFAASDGTTTAVLAQLRQRYVNLTEIDIMLYESNYEKYFRFPMESLLHFLFFLGLLMGAIIQILNQAE
jgi:hypothetical protein